MFQEYPKALYKGGQTGDMRVANDEQDEAAARADGFVDLAEESTTASPIVTPGRGRGARGA